jgi:AMMECR1 domain-containing protein
MVLLLACTLFQVLCSSSSEWSAAAKQQALAIARESVRAAVLGQAPPALPKRLLPPLRGRSGVFVTLSVNGRTRGCMGSLFPSAANLAEEIASAASMAATTDPYHKPIRPQELPLLQISLNVVKGRPWIARSISELRPARLGLCVQSSRGGGVMLPGEARTASWQLKMAKLKAGVPLNQPVQMLVFKTVFISESRIPQNAR